MNIPDLVLLNFRLAILSLAILLLSGTGFGASMLNELIVRIAAWHLLLTFFLSVFRLHLFVLASYVRYHWTGTEDGFTRNTIYRSLRGESVKPPNKLKAIVALLIAFGFPLYIVSFFFDG